jgi:hypothetical protein
MILAKEEKACILDFGPISGEKEGEGFVALCVYCLLMIVRLWLLAASSTGMVK